MANAYFQIIHQQDETTNLKIYPETENGDKIDYDELVRYLNLIGIGYFDSVSLSNYIEKRNYDKEYKLLDKEIFPENGRCIVTVEEGGRSAVARFYPPSNLGRPMTKTDILSDISAQGIVHGIREEAIDEFLEERIYCKDYMVAVATPPIQGHDANIKYHFDVNATAKPMENEDGSVDFHKLGFIKPIKVGDKLATLTPMDPGRKGVSVTGKELLPNKVKDMRLRFGRNITISENKCELFAQVSGHVSLVDDLVMVSDVYRVAANVDPSTGDIDYDGTVEIPGDVKSGFKVKATGDIIINGTVEAAEIISGGNIVIKRGMQGAGKGRLDAKGNIAVKFIENSIVRCDGEFNCDALVHCDVKCSQDVNVTGRKGLINGGHVRSYKAINATNAGSTMGTHTTLEIMQNVEHLRLLNEKENRIKELNLSIRKMDVVLVEIKKLVAAGNKVPPKMANYLKLAVTSKPKINAEIEELEKECENLRDLIDLGKNANIKITNTVNAGVTIIIKELSMVIKDDNIRAAKFIKTNDGIKMTSSI